MFLVQFKLLNVLIKPPLQPETFLDASRFSSAATVYTENNVGLKI